MWSQMEFVWECRVWMIKPSFCLHYMSFFFYEQKIPQTGSQGRGRSKTLTLLDSLHHPFTDSLSVINAGEFGAKYPKM